jgi:hypothetical protein
LAGEQAHPAPQPALLPELSLEDADFFALVDAEEDFFESVI